MSRPSSILRGISYARDGFSQIPEPPAARMASSPQHNHHGSNTNDAMIDIPLTSVATPAGKQYGAYNEPDYSPNATNEKTSLFRRATNVAKGRRGKVVDPQRGLKEGHGATLNSMGKIYNKILNFSIISRYILYVLPIGCLITVPIVIGATASKEANFGGVRIVWIFTWVLVVWVSLWVSKIFAKTLPYIFQFLCGIISPGTRKYASVLRSLEIPISLAGWALASLATFQPLMTQNPDNKREGGAVANWETIMQQILAALLVSSLIYLAEKLIIRLISIEYHRLSYELKIEESKKNLNLLSMLYEASRTLFPTFGPEFAEEDYIISDGLNISKAKRSRHGGLSGAVTPLRVLHGVNRVKDKLTSAFGEIATEVTGRQVFQPNSAHSIVVEALERKTSSEALAKRIWMSFVVEGKDALFLEDIIEVLGPDHQTEAEECFMALDKDGNSDIGLDEMILVVCEFARARKALATSLHDVGQAIGVLDNLLVTVVVIVCAFILVAFLNASFVTTLATAGTALLSLSFVFSTTAQEVLGSCIFLFAKHPFDVGDRVDINGESLLVERISLLYTNFKKITTHKHTQVSNSILNTLWIDNISRSKAMRETLLIYVNFGTSLEDIQLLRNEMQKFVLDKDNSRDFQPDVDIEVTGLNEMDKMELRIEIKHKSNWQNEAVRAARRSKWMCAMVLALRRVPIYGPGGGDAALGSADQPTYSVSVSDERAAEARENFTKSKEAARLVSSRPPQSRGAPSIALSTSLDVPQDTQQNRSPSTSLRNRSPTKQQNAETAALGSLNARSPTADPTQDWQASQKRPSFLDSTPSSDRRENELEQVRSLLHRTSTHGKRRTGDTLSQTMSIDSPMEQAPSQVLTTQPSRTESAGGYLKRQSHSQNPSVESKNAGRDLYHEYTSSSRLRSNTSGSTSQPLTGPSTVGPGMSSSNSVGGPLSLPLQGIDEAPSPAASPPAPLVVKRREVPQMTPRPSQASGIPQHRDLAAIGAPSPRLQSPTAGLPLPPPSAGGLAQHPSHAAAAGDGKNSPSLAQSYREQYQQQYQAQQVLNNAEGEIKPGTAGSGRSGPRGNSFAIDRGNEGGMI